MNLCYNKTKQLAHASALEAFRALPGGETKKLCERASALHRALDTAMRQKQTRVAHAAALAQSLSPFAVLARGYSVATAAGGCVLRSSAQAAAGDAVRVQLLHGALHCEVRECESED